MILKNIRYYIVSAIALPFVANANGQIDLGVNFSNITGFDSFDDLSLNTANIDLGYKIRIGAFSVTPKVKYGVGVGSDTISIAAADGFLPGAVEVDYFASVSTKLDYSVSDVFQLYLEPSFAKTTLDTTFNGFPSFDQDWELGIGIGASYMLLDNFAIELSYSKYDQIDIVSGGARYYF